MIKIPKISTIIAVCSLLAFLGTGYGWISTSARNSIEKEMMRTEIANLKQENKAQQDEIDDLQTGIDVTNSNLELLLRHFGIQPATAEK
jgi:hypothetical protein